MKQPTQLVAMTPDGKSAVDEAIEDGLLAWVPSEVAERIAELETHIEQLKTSHNRADDSIVSIGERADKAEVAKTRLAVENSRLNEHVRALREALASSGEIVDGLRDRVEVLETIRAPTDTHSIDAPAGDAPIEDWIAYGNGVIVIKSDDEPTVPPSDGTPVGRGELGTTMLITKTFDFDAAHQLDGLPKRHKCSHMHGHTYRVMLGFSGWPVPGTGFLAGLDYADIAAAWESIHRKIDHKVLNKVKGIGNPTTENLVLWVMNKLSRDKRVGRFLSLVRVYESSSTYCELSRDEFDAAYSNRK